MAPSRPVKFLGRARDLAREHPVALLGALLSRIPFHPIHVVYFHRLELRGAPAPSRRPHDAIPIRKADPDDLERLVRCIDKREMFERRFAAGEICLAAVQNDAIVGFEWFSTKENQVEERYRYEFALPDDALYAYDAYTAESHRDRGAWRQIIAAAAGSLVQGGRRRILAHVEIGNSASYAAHRRVGFRPIERYLFCSVLGLRFLRRTWVAPPS